MAEVRLTDFLRFFRRLAPESGEPVDGELLARFARDGDQAAFEMLVHRHGPMVWSVCRRLLKDVHDAEDAFQATFLVLARKATTIRKHASAGSWLHGVARRVAAKVHESARRPREGRLPRPVPDPGEEAAARELLPVLDEELARFPEKYRAPLVVCCLEGLTRDEAARLLRWPPGTVAGRLARGRERLRERLLRRGVEPPFPASAAPLPASLLPPLLHVAAGGSPSPVVLALTRGVLREMFWKKLTPLLVLLVVGVLAAGGAFASFGERGGPSTEIRKGNESTPDGWQVERTRLADMFDKPTALALSPDGWTLAASSGNGAVRLWDLTSGKLTLTIAAKLPDKVGALAYSPDGRLLAVGVGDQVRVYRGARLKRLFRQEKGAKEPRRTVRELLFSPDGKTLAAMVCPPLSEAAARAGSGALPTHVVGWGLDADREFFARVLGNVYSMSFTHDSKMLVAGGKMFPTLRGRVGSALTTTSVDGKGRGAFLRDLDNDHVALAVSPDGRLLATAATDFRVRLCDLSGKFKKELWGHARPIRVLAFAPDGRVLATGGDDKEVVLWDVKRAKQLVRLKGQPAGVRILRFLEEGRKLISVNHEGVVTTWVKGKS
jgi:RNA polymerase sigma factor (sigma-70 family)